MAKIKIISNPYNRKITFCSFNELNKQWEDIRINNVNSRLREEASEKAFLPFRIKEIVDTIINEYYTGLEKVEVLFEGTQDEYA